MARSLGRGLWWGVLASLSLLGSVFGWVTRLGSARSPAARPDELQELWKRYDVVAALAVGASAVAVGRPVLWRLAVEGQAGSRTSSRPCAPRSETR